MAAKVPSTIQDEGLASESFGSGGRGREGGRVNLRQRRTLTQKMEAARVLNRSMESMSSHIVREIMRAQCADRKFDLFRATESEA